MRSRHITYVDYGSFHRKPYGCMAFIVDCVMTMLTSGLWLIWIFCRELRKR